MPKSPKNKLPGVVKEGLSRKVIDIQDEEEENSTDSVEQAAQEAIGKFENVFDQDSLMFEDVDDVELPVDDNQYEVSGRGQNLQLSGLPEVSDVLLDETDSTINTPYGSPMSPISSISSIQKWTGEVKKMLLDDQKQSESRSKVWVLPPPPQVTTSASPADRPESIVGLEGCFLVAQADIDVMPTAEELAEKYSNELIEKEKCILLKDAKILELERSFRDIMNKLEDCQKTLKLKTESASAGVDKVKHSLEEKNKSIMETSDKLRKVTESYNSSEKRWKEQQQHLERQIYNLKTELESTGNFGQELEKLKQEAIQEKLNLEELLESAKKEIKILKRQFSEEKILLEDELKSLRDEKIKLEEELQEEIKLLEDKLMLSEQAYEDAQKEKEIIQLELTLQEKKNQELFQNINKLQVAKQEIFSQKEHDREELEAMIDSLKGEKEHLHTTFVNEKRKLESKVQTLTEQVALQMHHNTSATNEFETQVKELKEKLYRVNVQNKETENEATSTNFFTQGAEKGGAEQFKVEWLETKNLMEHRIAELELEKGNLLLQLVDIDEQQEAESAFRRLAHNQEQQQMQQEFEATKSALEESMRRIDSLEVELEESKQRDRNCIESAMSTIAWEEKLEILLKENENLRVELLEQRKSSDVLARQYSDLEKKYSELELGRPPIEGLVEIDRSDGWSDDSPQIPEADEGFTEDPQITELKEELYQKQQEISALCLKHQTLENELSERGKIVTQYESALQNISSEKSIYIEQLDMYKNELERVQKELLKKRNDEQKSIGDGWVDGDVTIIPDAIGGDFQGKVIQLEQELLGKNEELNTTTLKCRTFEEKFKKALKVLKQKNDRIIELKNRLGEDLLTSSTISVVETSSSPVPTQESAVTNTLASEYEGKDIEHLHRNCQQKDARIAELETVVKYFQDNNFESSSQISSTEFQGSKTNQVCLQHQKNPELARQERINFTTDEVLSEKNLEIDCLKKELTQLASTLNSKNDEIDLLMKTCSGMQKSVDEKVELLNDCVAKKDEEVRQAISQYEDFLKDATLNVSQLTKELEEKIRDINLLQGNLQEAQESLLDAQNEIEQYRRDFQTAQENLVAKDYELETKIQIEEQLSQELRDKREVERQLRQELLQIQNQVTEIMSNNEHVNEALDRAEAEKKQLKEESVCVHNNYSSKNKELQVKISQLIDQLNERESTISLMDARLKDGDQITENILRDIRSQLEEKTKALEHAEQTLFVKTEENLRIEEKIKENQERHIFDLEESRRQMQEIQTRTLQNFVAENGEDRKRTQEELARRNADVAAMQGSLTVLEEKVSHLQQGYNAKCSELAVKEQAVKEIESLRANVQNLETTIASNTQTFKSLQIELNQKNEELQNLQNVCSQYEAKLHNSAMFQDEVQRSLQNAEKAYAQRQQDLDTYIIELQLSKIEIEKSKEMCSNYQEQVKQLNMDIDKLKTEAASYTTQIQRMSSQLLRQTDTENSLRRYMEDLNSATEELGKKNSEMWDLEKMCKTQQTQINTLQANAEMFKNELREIQKLIADKDEQISRLEAEIWESTILREKENTSSKCTDDLLTDLVEKSKEISDLRFELDEGILQGKKLKKTLDEKDREIQILRAKNDKRGKDIIELNQLVVEHSTPETLVTDGQELTFNHRLESIAQEKQMLERKINLLQNKLAEVETSEVKCYEDFSKLKILRTELEIDNLRMSAELEQLRRSILDGDHDPKYKSMENQIVLMTKTLEDRDKLCRELMSNISEVQQAHDVLLVRVNDMQVQQIPSQYLAGSLEATVLDLDRIIFSLKIDVEREKKIRELYEGLLFLAATSKKQFESGANKSSGWFGLGDLFSSGSASPPRYLTSTPASRTSFSTSMAQQFTSPYSAGAGPTSLPFASTPPRPRTPARPETPTSLTTTFNPILFDSQNQNIPTTPLVLPPVTHYDGLQETPADGPKSTQFSSPK